MISNEKCKQILNGGDHRYTDEEIDLIKQYLQKLARLNRAVIENLKMKKK